MIVVCVFGVCVCVLQDLWVICAWWYLNGGCGSEEHATLTVLAYQTPSTYYSSRGMVAQEYTDTMLVTYLATLTKGADGLNEAIDKLSLVNTGGTSGRYMVIDTCFTSLILARVMCPLDPFAPTLLNMCVAQCTLCCTVPMCQHLLTCIFLSRFITAVYVYVCHDVAAAVAFVDTGSGPSSRRQWNRAL